MNLPKISSLYGRIFAIFWFTMLLVVIAVLMIPRFDPRQLQDAPDDLVHRMQQSAQRLSEETKNSPTLEAAIHSINNKYEDSKSISYYFLNQQNKIFGQSTHFRMRALNNFTTVIQENDPPQQRLYGRNMVSGPIPITLAGEELKMFVIFKWQQPPPFLLQLFDRPFQLLLVVMLTSTPFLLWLAWALSRPAIRLEQAAQKVATGQFEVDPNLEKGPKEFKQAGASFNQMVLAINNMMSSQQRLLSDISHELRSPLTRLRMANALAIRKQGTSSELERIDTEAERLEAMIADLLELSRQQADSHQVRQNLNASTLWEELVDDAKFEAEQLEKTLHTNTIPECTLTGNPSLLMSAVENVIRNAIVYGKQNVWVYFDLQDRDLPNQLLSITIEDDGDGVDEYELEAIFRPFYRVSTARDRHSGGSGLGLAITHSAILQHNGEISAQMSKHGGLSITISLPVNNS